MFHDDVRVDGQLPSTPADELPAELQAVLERFSDDLTQHLLGRIREELRHLSEPEPLLDVKGVALRLNTSVRTVEALVADRQLVPIRIRGARRFSPEAVDDFIRSCARRTRGGRVAR